MRTFEILVKSEIRNPKSERSPKPETRGPKARQGAVAKNDFGIRCSDFFRISDFGFRISFANRPSSSGFTLLEITLALAVSAIALAGIGGVFYSGLRLRERTVAMLDESAPLQQALAVLRRDLHGAVPPGGVWALPDDFIIQPGGGGLGQEYRLQFFTSTQVIAGNDNAPWGDRKQVVYELRPPTEPTRTSGKDLVRSVTRNLLGTIAEPEEQRLLRNVQSLEFAGFDGASWPTSWDTTQGNTNLPTAVRVRLQLGADNPANLRNQQPFEMVIPLVSQSRTNQTQSGGAQ